jgi:uncharacterized membrane protein (UPF0127 family)
MHSCPRFLTRKEVHLVTRMGLLILAMAIDPGCGRAVTGGSPVVPRGTVTLPGGRSLSVEVADTPAKQARGYMFREEVPEGEGMVFLMDRLDIHPFWMKNCLVSLDIIWMDEDWRIVHIEESVPPCREDPCPSVAPMRKSRYILEVAGGQSRNLRLEEGDRLRYAPPEPGLP